MYYPFLRARQFELIAIRELVAESAIQGLVVPVLEPVRAAESSLNLANRALLDHGAEAYLILNPQVGEIKGDKQHFSRYLSSLSVSGFLPAFLYSNNADYINNTIDTCRFTDCLLICDSTFTDNSALRDLCMNSAITHIMLSDPKKERRLDTFIKGLNKTYIRLDDFFDKQEKNADFLTIPAHKFSEEHLFYKEDGFQGFSDFTILPSEFSESGSTPRAVVIHLSYLNPAEENQIWIRHFTSETNDSIADVQGKFAEATKKALDFCGAEGLDNSAIAELRGYYDDQRYPGLGIVKKISIKNHLLVVSEFLR
jgi:hypothetical protein